MFNNVIIQNFAKYVICTNFITLKLTPTTRRRHRETAVSPYARSSKLFRQSSEEAIIGQCLISVNRDDDDECVRNTERQHESRNFQFKIDGTCSSRQT